MYLENASALTISYHLAVDLTQPYAGDLQRVLEGICINENQGPSEVMMANVGGGHRSFSTLSEPALLRQVITALQLRDICLADASETGSQRRDRGGGQAESVWIAGSR